MYRAREMPLKIFFFLFKTFKWPIFLLIVIISIVKVQVIWKLKQLL